MTQSGCDVALPRCRVRGGGRRGLFALGSRHSSFFWTVPSSSFPGLTSRTKRGWRGVMVQQLEFQPCGRPLRNGNLKPPNCAGSQRIRGLWGIPFHKPRVNRELTAAPSRRARGCSVPRGVRSGSHTTYRRGHSGGRATAGSAFCRKRARCRRRAQSPSTIAARYDDVAGSVMSGGRT